MSVTPTSFTPTPYIFKDRYTTIKCGLPDYEGFEAEVRKNLTNGELRELRAQLKAIDDEIDAIKAAHEDEAKAIDAARAELAPDDAAGRQANTQALIEFLTRQTALMVPVAERRKGLVAPYIRAWNLYDTTDETNPKSLPAPQQIGEAAFDYIDATLTGWLIQTVLGAYQGGRGFLDGSRKSAAAPEPTPAPNNDEPKVINLPSSRASRRKSSSASSATSKD